MPYAVELFFDQRTDTAVRSLWQWLADEGIATYMASSGSVPHVSLGVFDEADEERLTGVIRQLAATSPPLSLAFNEIEGFVSTGVLFLAPETSPELQSLHDRFCELLGPDLDTMWSLYKSDSWVPHCTLAMELHPCSRHLINEMRRALLEHIEVPWPAIVERIGLVKFRPVEQRISFSLGG